MREARKLALEYLVGFVMHSSSSVTCPDDTVGRGRAFSESSRPSPVASSHAAGRLSIGSVSGSTLDICADPVEGRMPRTVPGENTD